MSMISAPAPGDWDYRPFAPIPFDRFRAELMELYAPPLRAAKTMMKMRQVTAIAAGLVGPSGTTADLTPALVARFLAGRPPGESPYTTRGLLANLRSACSYARSRGYLRTSPFDYRKNWVRVGQPAGKKHHPIEDIRRVLDLLAREAQEAQGWARWRARRIRALAATVAYTGVRRDEALNLHAADVDPGARMILLVERQGGRYKTEASAQPVPMPTALVPILLDWMPHRMDPVEGSPAPPDCPFLFPNVTRTNRWKDGPMGYRPTDQLKAAGERVGVPGFTFQSLRHSYATHAESSWGLSPATIQRILRHTSTRTQLGYRHADADNLRAATGGIDFGPPAAPGPGGGPTP